ncbi:hypothetical protein Cgig2_019693 [Carnegiea gigantea]|uniref:Uncharacterized protein n=1 Tax=Carnegiea gigantea TaxID=171969 RepID=A0A9Q1KMW7_9CARY|nr:hypothetical protein Cgig2_019693 [Carnegiea gigantea]
MVKMETIICHQNLLFGLIFTLSSTRKVQRREKTPQRGCLCMSHRLRTIKMGVCQNEFQKASKTKATFNAGESSQAESSSKKAKTEPKINEEANFAVKTSPKKAKIEGKMKGEENCALESSSNKNAGHLLLTCNTEKVMLLSLVMSRYHMVIKIVGMNACTVLVSCH